jgi:SWI/SNF-related matrix-associated actin-dependent regulator 1 of chromatin subfamily A
MKLQLDESISADEKAIEGKAEEMVAKMLLEAESSKETTDSTSLKT